jgi:hypothetical protein
LLARSLEVLGIAGGSSAGWVLGSPTPASYWLRSDMVLLLGPLAGFWEVQLGDALPADGFSPAG